MDADEVIAEVRAAKERIAARYGYDVRALARALRVKQGKDGREVINVRPTRPVTTHSDRIDES